MERFRRLQEEPNRKRPPPPDIDMTLAALEQMRDLSATQALTSMILSAEQAASWQVGFHTSPNLQVPTITAAGEVFYRAYNETWEAMYGNALEQAEAASSANIQTTTVFQRTSSAAPAGVHNPAFVFPGLGMPPTAVRIAAGPSQGTRSNAPASRSDQDSATIAPQNKDKEATLSLADNRDINGSFVDNTIGIGREGMRGNEVTAQGVIEFDASIIYNQDDECSEDGDLEEVRYIGRGCRNKQAETTSIDSTKDLDSVYEGDGGVLIVEGLEAAVPDDTSPLSISYLVEGNSVSNALDVSASAPIAHTGDSMVTISEAQIRDTIPEAVLNVTEMLPKSATDTALSAGVASTAAEPGLRQKQDSRTSRQFLLDTSAGVLGSRPAVNFTCPEEHPRPHTETQPSEPSDRAIDWRADVEDQGFRQETQTPSEEIVGRPEESHGTLLTTGHADHQSWTELTVNAALVAVNPVWQAAENQPQFVLDRWAWDIDLSMAMGDDSVVEVGIKIDEATQLRILDGSIRLPTRFKGQYLTEPPLPVDLSLRFDKHEMPRSFGMLTMGDIEEQVDIWAGVAFALGRFGPASHRRPFHPQSMTAAPGSDENEEERLVEEDDATTNGLLHQDGDNQSLEQDQRDDADEPSTNGHDSLTVTPALAAVLTLPPPSGSLLQKHDQNPGIVEVVHQQSQDDESVMIDGSVKYAQASSEPKQQNDAVATGFYSTTSISMAEEIVDLRHASAVAVKDHETESPPTNTSENLKEQIVIPVAQSDSVHDSGEGKANDEDSAPVHGHHRMIMAAKLEASPFGSQVKDLARARTKTMPSKPVLNATEQTIDWRSSEGLKMYLPGIPSARQRLWEHMKINSDLFTLQNEATARAWSSKYKLRKGLSDAKVFFLANEERFQITLRVMAGNKSTSEIEEDFKELAKNYGSHYLTSPPVPLRLSVSFDDCKAEIGYHPATLGTLLTGMIGLMEHGRMVFGEDRKVYESDMEEVEQLSPGFYEEICKHGDGMPKYTRK